MADKSFTGFDHLDCPLWSGTHFIFSAQTMFELDARLSEILGEVCDGGALGCLASGRLDQWQAGKNKV